MDLGVFLLSWLFWGSWGVAVISGKLPEKVKTAYAISAWIVAPLAVLFFALSLQYCWGLSVAKWLGAITLTEAYALLCIGFLLVPFSVVPRDDLEIKVKKDEDSKTA